MSIKMPRTVGPRTVMFFLANKMWQNTVASMYLKLSLNYQHDHKRFVSILLEHLLETFIKRCKGGLILESFSIQSFPQKDVPNHYPQFFQISNKVQHGDLAHFFDEKTEVKKFLRLTHLYLFGKMIVICLDVKNF